MAILTEVRRFSHSLSVGKKLGTGFGAIGAITAVLALLMFSAIGALTASAEAGQDAYERREAAKELELAAALMRTTELTYVADHANGRDAFENSTHEFEVALAQLRGQSNSGAETALLNKISTGYQTFLLADQIIWDAVLTGDHEVAHRLTLGAAALNFGFMAADTEAYAEQTRFDQLEASHDLALKGLEIRIRIAALGVLALVLVAAASWYMTGLIRDPLLALQRAAEQAADGDLGTVAEVHGADEIGRLAAAFNTMLRQLNMRELALLDEHRRQQAAAELDAALELAEGEPEVYEVLRRSLGTSAPKRSTELLIAEHSRAHFHQATVAGPSLSGPGCGVSSPYACPAVRSAKPMSCTTSSALDACPHLADRPAGPCSAICVPVSFMGRSVGVLHSTDTDGTSASSETRESLTALADAAGARIGVIRSTAKTEMHATTDSLTGLRNRRTFEIRARAMHRDGEPFTLVMADLDHFKLLNDTYGHEAGDRALQLFSEVLQNTVREGDAVSRWGGEEFTIALANADDATAAELLNRLASELKSKIAATGTTPFTASFGYVDASKCPNFETAIRVADGALYEAKDQGRARAVCADPSTVSHHLAPPSSQSEADRDDELADHF